MPANPEPTIEVHPILDAVYTKGFNDNSSSQLPTIMAGKEMGMDEARKALDALIDSAEKRGRREELEWVLDRKHANAGHEILARIAELKGETK